VVVRPLPGRATRASPRGVVVRALAVRAAPRATLLR